MAHGGVVHSSLIFACVWGRFDSGQESSRRAFALALSILTRSARVPQRRLHSAESCSMPISGCSQSLAFGGFGWDSHSSQNQG
jgi:hypothetical protein